MAPRSRNSQSVVNTDYRTTYTLQLPSHNAVPSVSTDEGTYVSETSTLSMEDVVTPEYKKLSAMGSIINNPMTRTHIVERDSLCFQQTKTLYQQWNATCVPGGEWHDDLSDYVGTRPSSVVLNYFGKSLPTYSYQDLESLKGQALAKAWSRVDLTEIQSLVVAAEGEKTVKSLVSIYKRLIKVIKMIKHLDLKSLSKEVSAKELASRYMELRYALRPLVYDVAGCATALSNTESDKPQRITFRGKKTDYVGDSGTSTWDTVKTQPFPGTHGWTNVYEWEYYVAATIRAGVLTEVLADSQLAIWGVLQPFESLWEVIPFSFIIDWFLDVSDKIAQWTPNYGTHALASWVTAETWYYQYERVYWKDVYFSGGSSTWRWITHVERLDNCFRDKMTHTKTRTPEPSRAILPSFTVRLNCLKLIDLGIIAKQLWFRGR